MKIKIDFWLTGKASWETEAADLKTALEIGVKAGVDFSYALLDGAHLDGACLDNASLDHANLANANLAYASISYAHLDGACLDNASFIESNLIGVNFDFASLCGARLDRANLAYASFIGANLVDARLDGADFASARIDNARVIGTNLAKARNLQVPTGETWEEYLTQTVPALLTAGGKSLDDVANPEHWNCHDWANCPIRAAFGVDSTDKVHPLYRQHAKQFVSLFDAGQIPLEKVNPKMGKDAYTG